MLYFLIYIMKIKSLSTARPDLAGQFHLSKNSGISPDEIPYLYKKEVWWFCEKGHEWCEKVSSRSRQKHADCKICGSLANTHSEQHLLLAARLQSPWQIPPYAIYWIFKRIYRFFLAVTARVVR